jgi:abortive phage resistance protein AbiGi (putative antitoxin)
MADAPRYSPGTVSRILWHFTGGPTWNETENRQNNAPKPAAQAFENLVSVLSTKELRLGRYKEVFRVQLPRKRVFDLSNGTVETLEDVPEEIASAPVCCLSDIPAVHLGYHAYRYGKFALGFHRDAAVKHGFNPVLYSLEDAGVVRSIYTSVYELQSADTDAIVYGAQQISSMAGDVSDGDHAGPHASDIASDIESQADAIATETDALADSIERSRQAVSEFLAFVKTFNPAEFGTVYCEREWRSVRRAGSPPRILPWSSCRGRSIVVPTFRNSWIEPCLN